MCVCILLCLWRLDNHSNIGQTLAHTHTHVHHTHRQAATVTTNTELFLLTFSASYRYVNAMLRLARFSANWRFAWCACEPYQAATTATATVAATVAAAAATNSATSQTRRSRWIEPTISARTSRPITQLIGDSCPNELSRECTRAPRERRWYHDWERERRARERVWSSHAQKSIKCDHTQKIIRVKV